MYPEELRYSKDHEWIRVEGDRGRIGVTDYAQNQLGDVVFLELPEVGQTLAPGHDRVLVGVTSTVCEIVCVVEIRIVRTLRMLQQGFEAIQSLRKLCFGCLGLHIFVPERG